MSRASVRKTRSILIPLIGEPAFSYCLRSRRLVNSLPLPLLLGVVALVGTTLSSGAGQLAMAGLWVASVVYCLVALLLLTRWREESARLAGRKISGELGYPIRIRGVGGVLELGVWKRQTERAIQRHRRATPVFGSGKAPDSTDRRDPPRPSGRPS
ncbi:MAG TPA: hypothetical protein VNH20_10235 [Candidatus Dormibacteraeota bacterium]|nr:hypothetical protein [Candidatus Dormibacteraeota bacterium]